jgi:hypothetical protein
MPAKTKTTVDLRLFVRFEDSQHHGWGTRYSHVYVQPVVLGRDHDGAGKYEAWNVDSYSLEIPASVRALAGLTVRAQMDESTAQGPAPWYGYRVMFADADVTLADAERMLPILRRIDRKMTALSDRFGYPRDLPGFLAHLADALGLAGKPFVTRVTGDADYEGHGHRSRDVDSLRYWLDDCARDWRKRHSIPEPDAA